MELNVLQHYWWIIISVLASLLVFLTFVQGGQTMFLSANGYVGRQMLVNSMGRKWELTYTTLVLFGGAFFASFPLYYSTSFGGAYWLWILLLLSFTIQAFSYEFRRKPGNLVGTRFYDILLYINGSFGVFMVGLAVGQLFFGAPFEVSKSNLVVSDGTTFDSGIISQWASTHGLEAFASWKCWLMGITLAFLARFQGALYFINNLKGDAEVLTRNRRTALISGLIFLVLFIVLSAVIFSSKGVRMVDGSIPERVSAIYFKNMIEMVWPAVLFVGGALMVVYAYFRTIANVDFRKGIWWSGLGTVLVIFSLFVSLGFCDTAYMYSTTIPSSSLTIANSSSSLFTLKVMSCVSLLVPFVIAYIAYVWRKMDLINITPEEINSDEKQY